MDQLKEKLRVFVWPYLIVALSFLLLYSACHWLFFIRMELFAADQDVLNYWAPMGLAWIPVLLFFRERLLKLQLRNPENKVFLIQMYLWLAISVPTVLAQTYLIAATGKLTNLQVISDITKLPPTKYYHLSQTYIDKANAGVVNDAEISGKLNEDFKMYLYVVLPIFDKPADTSSHKTVAWYALKYSKTVSNKLSPEQKEKEFRQFANESQHKFDRLEVNNFSYLEKVPGGQDKDAWLAAIHENKPFAGSGSILLQPQSGDFTQHTPSILWTILAFILAFVIWAAIIIYTKIKPREQPYGNDWHTPHTADHGHAHTETRQRPVPPQQPSFFKPHKGYYVTPALMYLNIGVYLLMVVSGLGVMAFRADDLLHWGANYRPYTINGQWWRLLTSTFLHGGLVHMASNMFGLVFAGAFLEPLLGGKRLLIAYLTAGIVASAASIAWHPDTVSVGASGAIFGLFGMCVVFLAKAYKNEYAKRQLYNILMLIGYNLLWGLSGGIDNAAHIGGLISGMLVGLILHPGVKRRILEMQKGEPLDEENLD
ncbi:Membrane associated serine protease, rhomboid family [Chitinophaga jiangningensis]|uniref:Membrane associated serine protease, rhomboid family n=1 Tax=Chitinophaga jiangningensis TaxID=1419482 RepID=A0A1M6VR55_9BACT|nr:rhomboid family intramembrane serine protease [Chitinophaga jiangningensis]SHK83949.1 Membrane associated serine protease, rhomboid family [Chitinophaga jiangningensis]